MNNGRAVVPVYVVRATNGGFTYDLVPAMLKGYYTVEVGAPSNVADALYCRFKQIVGVRTRLKFENTVVMYVVESVVVEEPRIQLRDASYVVIKTVSPAILPNPLVPNQQVKRFTASPGVMLWVPRMISYGVLTGTGNDTPRSYLEQEECLAEHYSTRLKAVFVNYDNNRESALTAKAKYILVARGYETRARRIELLEKTLTAAKTYGIGASRANGFGTITAEKQNHPIKTKVRRLLANNRG
ncbi:MAG: hypothetical protein QXK88_04045 [Desulfurococcaceae archaeon]